MIRSFADIVPGSILFEIGCEERMLICGVETTEYNDMMCFSYVSEQGRIKEFRIIEDLSWKRSTCESRLSDREWDMRPVWTNR